ncbi:hypothetical protein ACFY1P_20345 [Streptomyces sp. NPDC001407]|uniref:hypothetical protein n=1 Tax=Streptomyces sp. NPDC001407 TaxID=3364573 RepID=UPI0036AEDC48
MKKRTPVARPRPSDLDDDDWYEPDWPDGSSHAHGLNFLNLPGWVPLDRVRSIAAGDRWHAIRVPYDDGRCALRALQSYDVRIGPVIANELAGHVTFLIELHLLTVWNVHGTRLLRPGTMVEIPPPTTTHGKDVRWLVLPEKDGGTHPRDLKRALTGAPPATVRLPQPARTTRRRAPRSAGPRS